MLLRNIFIFFFLSHFAHATAQPAAFRTFLSGFKKCTQINMTSFGERIISDSVLINGDIYARFLPPIQDDCLVDRTMSFGKKEVTWSVEGLSPSC